MGLLESIRNAAEAAQMAFRMKQGVTYHPHGADDAPPQTFIEDAIIAASLIEGKEREKWLRRASSEAHGSWILSQVFPRRENPHDYHSRNGVVVFSDRPVQVLGWQEFEDLIRQGIEEDLDEGYIRGGFYREAEARGIDPEMHFWEHPRGTEDNSSPLLKK